MLIKSEANKPSRRAVMKAATGCGLMSSMSIASAFLNLQASKALADDGDPNDYKSLVCVFLNGGNDSFNMLAPKGTGVGGEYDHYNQARSGLFADEGIALTSSELLDIAGPSPSRPFGLHPKLGEEPAALNSPLTSGGGTGLQRLYNNGKLAFVANVGSLIQPTTLADFIAKANLPVGLFSHSDLQRHWMTSVPQDRSHLYGWGGKMADILQSCNEPTANGISVSMNISLSGGNMFETGKSVDTYSIDNGTAGGATGVWNYSPDPASVTNTRHKAFNEIRAGLLSQTYTNLMSKTFAQASLVSMQTALEFNTHVTNVINSNTIAAPFDNDAFSQNLKRIAEVIGAREALGQRRQVFFIQLGGFDNHAGLQADHADNMETLSRGLSSFYQALIDLGVQDSVTAFSASDFGRTLTSNGQGSDHAWGGNHFVMGGAVDGGKIRGDYPTSLLTPVHSGASIDLGRGRLLPTTSVDQYNAELATWFGVSPSQLVDVLPNLNNFSGAPALNLFT